MANLQRTPEPEANFTQSIQAREYSNVLPHVHSADLHEDADLERGHAQRTSTTKYGDIGTSPLYVMSSVFSQVDLTSTALKGVVSSIFWSQTLILILKYSIIVLRADDNGNGGAFALYAQLKRGIDAAVEACQGHKTAAAAVEGTPATHNHTTADAHAQHAKQQHEHGQERHVLQTPASRWSKCIGAVRTACTARLDGQGWRMRMQRTKAYQRALRILVVVGVGFILGDGVLTPSTSVLSAVEGIQTPAPNVSRDVIIAITCIILLLLFLVQFFGTARISYAFSPIVFVWFLFNLSCGVYNIVTYDPSILQALSPYWMVTYFREDFGQAWRSLSSVLLSFTGVEALFADLGHFNRATMRLSCLTLVWPCLTITYLGQAAYLMKNPQDVASTFYASLPNGTFWPMFLVATATTVVASQALISAVFSIIMQAIAQGFFPPFHVKHTNAKHVGQVYINIMNWMLACLCIIVVIAFRTSTKLGQAYGLAVNADIIITTCLMTLVMLFSWRAQWPLALLFFLVFFGIEGLYLSSSLLKVPNGGWFPLALAAIYGLLMLTWYYGTSRKQRYVEKHTVMLDDLIDWQPEQLDTVRNTLYGERLLHRATGHTLQQSNGVGLFFSPQLHGTPQPLVDFITRLKTVPKLTFVVTNRFVSVPHVEEEARVLIEPLTIPGFYHVVARYGYMEKIVQDDEFALRIVDQLRALLTDALHGLGSSGAPSQQSSLTSAAANTPAPVTGGGAVPLAPPPQHHRSIPLHSSSTTQQQLQEQQHTSALSAAAEELAAAPLFAGRAKQGHKDTDNTTDNTTDHTTDNTTDNTTDHTTDKSKQQSEKQQQSLQDPTLEPPVVFKPESVWGQPTMLATKPTFAHASAPHASAQHATASGPSHNAWSRTSPFGGSMSSLPTYGLPTPVVLRHASLPQDTLLEPGLQQAHLQRLALKRELQRLQDIHPDFVYVFGLSYIRAEPKGGNVRTWLRRMLLEACYTFLARNLGAAAYRKFNVPCDAFVELGAVCEM